MDLLGLTHKICILFENCSYHLQVNTDSKREMLSGKGILANCQHIFDIDIDFSVELGLKFLTKADLFDHWAGSRAAIIDGRAQKIFKEALRG